MVAVRITLIDRPMIQHLHPFPARMAPELALKSLDGLANSSVVLDPMMGSGTVVRQAVDLGHQSYGFDMDPLAVLISRVLITPVDDDEIDKASLELEQRLRSLRDDDITLAWIDDDPETEKFVAYWFGEKQRLALRRFAYLFQQMELAGEPPSAVLDVLRIALSRIIVTKEQMASLARDTSHSRPHRVVEESDYDVYAGFRKSLTTVRRRLKAAPPVAGAEVQSGDARKLETVETGTVDLVLTSPPYLNAIDYMRGHRLSLVWLGHKFSDLRTVRSDAIGAERKASQVDEPAWLAELTGAMGEVDKLPHRYQAMIERYVRDLQAMMQEVARVVKPSGQATFVMGNSCLKGVFVRNSCALKKAGELAGLSVTTEYERPLPERNRYLPVSTTSALGNRMRTETILTFAA